MRQHWKLFTAVVLVFVVVIVSGRGPTIARRVEQTIYADGEYTLVPLARGVIELWPLHEGITLDSFAPGVREDLEGFQPGQFFRVKYAIRRIGTVSRQDTTWAISTTCTVISATPIASSLVPLADPVP